MTTTRPFNLLQTFHTAISSHGNDFRDDSAALALEAAEDDDLLNEVEDKDVVDLRTPGQARFMDDLIGRLTRLDPATGEAARTYTLGMTEHGKWTPGREGNASKWIDRMISKEAELKADRPVAPAPQGAPEIPAGRYAIVDGEVKCYSVAYGKEGTRWEGFTFLARISSDDEFPIRNRGEKERILAAIGQDVEAARILAAHTLRRCSRCGRQLSDTKNPYFAAGLGPDCGAK